MSDWIILIKNVMNQQNSFPAISVVIPAHNEERYLPVTLKGLLAAACELDLTCEVIVVNDASTDATGSIIDQFRDETTDDRLSVIRRDVDLRNIGAVRNSGAEIATHSWLFFVDADTTVPVQVLKESLDLLADGAVGGGAWVQITDDGKLPAIKWLMYKMVVLVWQSMARLAAGCYMFCLKSKFEDFGGFDEEYFAAEELFFSRNLKKRGVFKLTKSSVITSARKLHSYSTWQLLRFIFRPIFTRKGVFKSKTGLEVLYEDKR